MLYNSQIAELLGHSLIQSYFLTRRCYTLHILFTFSTVYYFLYVYPSSNEPFVLHTFQSSGLISYTLLLRVNIFKSL